MSHSVLLIVVWLSTDVYSTAIIQSYINMIDDEHQREESTSVLSADSANTTNLSSNIGAHAGSTSTVATSVTTVDDDTSASILSGISGMSGKATHLGSSPLASSKLGSGMGLVDIAFDDHSRHSSVESDGHMKRRASPTELVPDKDGSRSLGSRARSTESDIGLSRRLSVKKMRSDSITRGKGLSL